MSTSVSQDLKQHREALHLSLTKVELATKIRGKYLIAIESGDYTDLPNDIYSRGFVHQYASFLGLDGAVFAERYTAERGGLAAGPTRTPQLARSRRLVITGRLLTLGMVAAAIIGIVGYLLVQLSALAAPPRVTLDSPKSGQTLTESALTVSGRTTPGADIAVDDIAIATDSDGTFHTLVSLQDGLNSLRVTAQSKLGKTTTLTRIVVAKLSPAAATAVTLPTAPFDGVAIEVSVKRTSQIIVVADGKEVFRRIMLAGTKQVFRAGVTIGLTTSDAGATGVTVTNAAAASKSIPSLGGDGEVRRDQAFTKDTVL